MRPRTNPKERMAEAVKVEDSEAYVANLATKNGKEIKTLTESIKMELWYDKHYILHHQEGAREGIKPECVEKLMAKSLKHLLFYGSRVKGFTFLNYEGEGTATRIILKDSFSQESTLTVVAEAHFLNFNKYQFTVITAKCDDFKIGAGQYFVEFLSEDQSVLKRLDNGEVKEVLICQD